ncbi:MAG: helix-turn-helix domain-containing protein, partial [Lentisphaerae bacterium]|nr:helix-turn-helix domain-containing protein [Lentisphaerota bacterium]
MIDGPSILGVEQAAVFLGLHEETVRRFARERRLPGFKVGRAWRFSRDHLGAWIEAQHRARAPHRRVLVV